MKRDPAGLLMFVLLACIWGSSFILMYRGMHTADRQPIFSDMQVGALRMSIAGVIMLPFGLVALRRLQRKRDLLYFGISGFFGNFFPAFLFTFAETKLSSGLAGMLNSFSPFFTLLIGWAFFAQKLKLFQAIGLLVAFGGICLLVFSTSAVSNDGSWLHIGAIVLATAMYGLSLNNVKHRLSAYKSWEITSIAFTLVAGPALLCLLLTGTPKTFNTNPHAWEGLGFVAILSVIGTCVALLLFNSLIARTSAVFASSVTYLIPFVAIFIGVFANDEEFLPAQLVAIVVVLAGVWISGRAKK
jgi:drug/metabolite transporter (DMT)-like permease